MMRTRLTLLFSFLLAFAAQAVVLRPAIVPRYAGAAVGEWTMDHDAALAQAQAETNNVIVMFNGAWWCPHCQALENKVLTNDTWQAFVQSNRLYLVMMDNPGRADQYWCWLRETNYVQDVAGLTLAQGEAEITNRYTVQTAYAVPGAPTNTVKGVSYLRVGYPTLIALRPDGSRLGRFSPLMTTVSTEMVLRSISQLLGADAQDEADDYYPGATLLSAPLCEDGETSGGAHTLSETDAADWFAFDAAAGVQWSFAFRPAALGIAGDVKAQLFATPTSTVSVAERVMTPSAFSVLTAVIPQAGRYWLKVSRAQALQELSGYDLAYWYGTPDATIQFAAPVVSVSERSAAVTLTVNIAGASRDAEVRVSYETVAGSAVPEHDYTEVQGELVWGVGPKAPKTVTVPLVNDSFWEGDERFEVALYAVKNCEVGGELARCAVVIKESAARLPGKLRFDGAAAALLVEGSNALFQVARASGADGAVTARVDHIQGSVATPVATLVWPHGDAAAKGFAFAFTNEPGFQADRASSLRLTPLGGAALASSAGGVLALTRRDDLVVRTLAEYAADPANAAFAFKATRGLWLEGFASDAERAEAWLRCGAVAAGDSASLAATVTGPGLLAFDWRLDGDGSTFQALLGAKAAAGLTNTEARSGAALAVPSGRQTVTWTVRRGAGAAAPLAALKNLAWLPLPRAAAPQPSDQASVLIPNLVLAWQHVLAGFALPAGAEAHYELWAGTSSGALKLRSAQAEARFPREGSDQDRAALDALTAQAGANRPLYWRVDTVATDASGRRCVYAGAVWSVTLRPAGAPEFVPSEGGYDPNAAGGVALPDFIVGVAGEAGPLALANAGGGTVNVAVRNGALPPGVKPVVRDGAVWLAGAPTRAGEGSADLLVSVTRKVGGASVAAPGTSVKVLWKALPLGRAAGTFDGYLTENDHPGYGTAAVTVSTLGAISGRFLCGGLAYTFAAPSYGGQKGGTYVAQALAKAGTNTLSATLTVAVDGSAAELALVGAAPGALFPLKRNNWRDAEAQALLPAYTGAYTVAFPVLQKSSANAPGGAGYLTFTVKTDGAVAFSGQLADGKTFSGSTVLFYGPDCCTAEDRVTFYLLAKPALYRPGSGLYGLIYLEPAGEGQPKATAVRPGDFTALRWVNTDPASVFGYNPATGELPDGLAGFTNLVDAAGGLYDPLVNLQTFYGDAQLGILSGFPAPADYAGAQGASGYTLFSTPDSVRLPAAATGVATVGFPKIALVKTGGLVDFGASSNPWYLALRPTRATGVFSASCKFYYQGQDGAGATRQRTRDVACKGVFLPVRSAYQDYPEWMGFYLLPDACAYADGAKQKSYAFNWSHEFLFGRADEGLLFFWNYVMSSGSVSVGGGSGFVSWEPMP